MNRPSYLKRTRKDRKARWTVSVGHVTGDHALSVSLAMRSLSADVEEPA
jgi:hypothetical protein